MEGNQPRFNPYYAIAAGVFIHIATNWIYANWMLELLGWALCVYGAAELAARAPFYGAAIVCAGARMVLTLTNRALAFPFMQSMLLLFSELLFYAFLCFALCVQMRNAGHRSWPEWAVFVLTASPYILVLLAACGESQLNGWTQYIVFRMVSYLQLIGPLALVLNLLRIRRKLKRA